MKNLVLFISVLIFISCNKNDLPQEYWGESSAEKNNLCWSGYPVAGVSNINDKLYVESNVYSKEKYHRELLCIFKIPCSIGKFRINDTEVRDIDNITGADYITSVEDGDVMGDAYKISPTDSLSWIEITKIDDDEIWGNFDITFVRDTFFTISAPDIPDTIIFKNGTFHTKIL